MSTRWVCAHGGEDFYTTWGLGFNFLVGDEIHLYVVPATNLSLRSSRQSQEISGKEAHRARRERRPKRRAATAGRLVARRRQRQNTYREAHRRQETAVKNTIKNTTVKNTTVKEGHVPSRIPPSRKDTHHREHHHRDYAPSRSCTVNNALHREGIAAATM